MRKHTRHCRSAAHVCGQHISDPRSPWTILLHSISAVKHDFNGVDHFASVISASVIELRRLSRWILPLWSLLKCGRQGHITCCKLAYFRRESSATIFICCDETNGRTLVTCSIQYHTTHVQHSSHIPVAGKNKQCSIVFFAVSLLERINRNSPTCTSCFNSHKPKHSAKCLTASNDSGMFAKLAPTSLTCLWTCLCL